MAKGIKTGGRKKGTPNKSTVMVKDAISQAADDLGGKDALVKWVHEDKNNERIFWSQIYTKLIPVQHETGPEGLAVYIASSIKKT